MLLNDAGSIKMSFFAELGRSLAQDKSPVI